MRPETTHRPSKRTRIAVTQQKQQPSQAADADPLGADSITETPPDAWAALPIDRAQLARGLEGVTLEMARWLRAAKADALAGRLEAVGDPSELFHQTRCALDELALARAGRTAEMIVITQAELVARYWEQVAAERDAAPTGLGSLDKALGGGLKAGKLVALLGAPGSGKTTLAQQIAERVANAGRPVCYLTTEDTPAALLGKTLARVGGLDYGLVLEGREANRQAINAALADVAARQSASRLLYIEDTGRLGLADLQTLARTHFEKFNTAAGANGGEPNRGLLVVDYLQRWARGQRGPDVREELRHAVTRLIEDLRYVARELDCAVVALSSMSRASGYGRNGELSALGAAKESGDAEYTADVLMAITEPSEQQRQGWQVPPRQQPRILRIDKNRQGPIDALRMHWYPARQQWTEVAP
jgi:replicative DNA helicase